MSSLNTIPIIVYTAFLVISFVFIRHGFVRARFFLQMLQQNGYKTHEYRSWVGSHFTSHVLRIEHLLFNVVILVAVYFFWQKLTFVTGTLIMAIFAVFWFWGVGHYRPEKEKKPLVVTSRVKRLLVPFSLFLIFIYYGVLLVISTVGIFHLNTPTPETPENYFISDPYLFSFLLLMVDIAIPFLIFPAAWLMKPVESAIQNGFKRQARKKIASMPNLKVIAITGSYGKTSTKFVIDAFLKERFSVCTTPGSYNTPMGICKVINNDLQSLNQVLILEMGARYSGNIRELCEIARPDISVVTNVGISHLETFGSKEAVAEEKSTLARQLKPKGTLILNGDDPIVKEMGADRNDIQRILIGENGEVRAEEIETGPEGTGFLMKWVSAEGSEEQSERVKTKLLGDHNVQNILLAAAVARELGVRLKTVAIAASYMEPVEHRLELKKRGDLTVIDDAFNSNPVGAKSAVDVLASFKTGKRFIITPGMIELGEREEEENYTFGQHIGRAQIEVAILVGEERTQPIKEGIESVVESEGMIIKSVSTLFDANDLLAEMATSGDVVLYENDLPDSFNE